MSPPGPGWVFGWSFDVQPISYKRHRFPAEVIRYAVWLYFRFTLSLRDGIVSANVPEPAPPLLASVR